MEDRLQPYRHPMVASTGIMLGFILNFVSEWVPTIMTRSPAVELIIGVTLLICIPLLLVVMFRILDMQYPTDRAEIYYRRTLRMFIAGVSMPFISMLLVVIIRIIEHQ